MNKNDTEAQNKCSKCGSKNLIIDDGLGGIYCSNCGLFMEEPPLILGFEEEKKE